MFLRSLACLAVAAALASTSLGCTIFYAYDGTLAMGGNNEDWSDPATFVWFRPAREGAYGRIVFGFGNGFPQGGMNDQGLFYDGAATAPFPTAKDEDRPAAPIDVLDAMLRECATVDQAVALLDRYRIRWMPRAMIFLGDRHGNSAIYEGDQVVRGDGRHQVCTNYYQTAQSPEQAGCRRKLAAERLFRERFSHDEPLTIELMRDVLDATHANGKTVATQYSNVYDLTEGVVHLYAKHDFTTVVALDLEQELAKGERRVAIADLFPKTVAESKWNTRCPKSGRPVIPEAFFEHDGTRVYFCNTHCAVEGALDPDFWIAQAYPSGQAP